MIFGLVLVTLIGVFLLYLLLPEKMFRFIVVSVLGSVVLYSVILFFWLVIDTLIEVREHVGAS